jgi:hypothetical protein
VIFGTASDGIATDRHTLFFFDFKPKDASLAIFTAPHQYTLISADAPFSAYVECCNRTASLP